MRSKFALVLAAAAATGLASVISQAQAVNHVTQSYNFGPTGDEQHLSVTTAISGFNTSLGTLVGVHESFYYTTYNQLTVGGNGGGGLASVNYQRHNGTDQYVFTDILGNTFYRAINLQAAFCSIAPGQLQNSQRNIISHGTGEIDLTSGLASFESATGGVVGSISIENDPASAGFWTSQNSGFGGGVRRRVRCIQ
jgi:hypothetical protein